MLDQLMNIIRQSGQQQVVENPAIPNEYNDQVMNEAGSSIVGGLQQALAGGGLSQVMRLFGQGGSQQGIGSLMSNPLVQNIIAQFTGKLNGQFNLDQSQASQVSSNLIPQVLQNFAGRVTDPNDNSVDINGVMQSLTGGKASGIDFSGLLSKFSGGGDVDGDGDVDLQDIMAKMSGGTGGSGGGVVDMVKGLFK
jgi:hypothetical protein